MVSEVSLRHSRQNTVWWEQGTARARYSPQGYIPSELILPTHLAFHSATCPSGLLKFQIQQCIKPSLGQSLLVLMMLSNVLRATEVCLTNPSISLCPTLGIS